MKRLGNQSVATQLRMHTVLDRYPEIISRAEEVTELVPSLGDLVLYNGLKKNRHVALYFDTESSDGRLSVDGALLYDDGTDYGYDEKYWSGDLLGFRHRSEKGKSITATWQHKMSPVIQSRQSRDKLWLPAFSQSLFVLSGRVVSQVVEVMPELKRQNYPDQNLKSKLRSYFQHT